MTKRGVLSQASQLFDPLGWMSPVVIRAKCFIQATWLLRIGWDDLLPNEAAAEWEAFRSEFPVLRELRVTRWLSVGSKNGVMELHGFADASERAYAVVLYLRTVEKGDRKISLLMAKTKVASLKRLSIPWLELCAASLLTTIAAHSENFEVACYSRASMDGFNGVIGMDSRSSV